MIELDYTEIGRNIRRYRLERGLKQKTLAEMVNLTDQHISHIENATTQLSLPSLVAIANALGVDCNSLLDESLTRARRAVLREELAELLENISEDKDKLALRIELCRVLEKFDC